MEIVVNEWLLHYMSPESRDLSFSTRFLDFVQSKSILIVIKKPSPFTDKFYRFCRKHRVSNPKFGKRLALDMSDSKKVKIVSPPDVIPLPDEIQRLFIEKRIKEDDRYLVELAHSVPCSVIVTTDSPLVGVLKPFLDERIQLLNAFCITIGLAPPSDS